MSCVGLCCAVNECYLLSKPNHVMVDVGSNASFTSESNIANGISWYFTRLGEHKSQLLDNNTAKISIFLSSDLKVSTLRIHQVEKRFTGTYMSVDEHEAAFADLTVFGKLRKISSLNKLIG